MLPMMENLDSSFSRLPGTLDLYTMENQRLEEKGQHMVIKKEIAVNICRGCGLAITDRHLLKVGEDYFWHLHCLHCSRCQKTLDEFGTCFIRDQNVYCKSCFTSEFASPCSACWYPFAAGDWIRRVGGYVYHLHCFVCDQCQIPLSTGQSFSMVGHQLRCQDHSTTTEELGPLEQKPTVGAIKSEDAFSTGTNSSDDTCPSTDGGSAKRKRMRTTFTDRQLSVLRSSFQASDMPDPKRMQYIADTAGLTKKVTQVWFQNARTRQRQRKNSSTTSAEDGAIMSNYGIAQMMQQGTNADGASRYQQSPLQFHYN